MDKAEKAYIAAKKLIFKAKATGDWDLDLGTTATFDLTQLPHEITELTKLTTLSLRDTQVKDLSPISGMQGLTELFLDNTQVNDLAPISGMQGLTALSLSDTQVNDLSPISGIPRLAELSFSNTQVSDISPINDMQELTVLFLQNTQVNDLSPISGIPRLAKLSFSNTQVSDISPISDMQELTELFFSDTQVNDLSPISEIPRLAKLSFGNTQVSDISPISGMQMLTELFLNSTQVNDLSPISGMQGLTLLSLDNTLVNELSAISEIPWLDKLSFDSTQISDLSPISSMKRLTVLSLDNTQVNDLSPISEIPRLAKLSFNNTQISDLSPISGMLHMTDLSFDDTQVSDLIPIRGRLDMARLSFQRTLVSDLRPVAKMKKLPKTRAGYGGVFFESTPAVSLSNELAEIASLGGASERSYRLLKYMRELKDWPPVNAPLEAEPANTPGQLAAPIMAGFEGNILVELPATHDLSDEMEKRAHLGWEALKEFYDDVHETLMKDNLPNLQRAIRAFGKALGDKFEDMKEVSLGTHGLRIVEISRSANTILLEDAANDLNAFSTAIQLHLQRYPEWAAYLEDAIKDSEPDLAPAMPQLQEIKEQFKEVEFISDDLAQKFDGLVQVAEEQDLPAPIARHGILTSLSNILSPIAKKVLKLGRDFVSDLGKDAYKKIVGGTIPSLGLLGADLFINKGAVLLSLAQKFPDALGWIEGILRFLNVL